MNDDATLGGYERVHDRPAAFEGSDGRAYSAEVFVDETPDADGRYGAALLFVRWSAAGDRADGVLETPCLMLRDTAEEAGAGVRALSLLEVKRHLDATIARSRSAPTS
jgi:hypothetical protein